MLFDPTRLGEPLLDNFFLNQNQNNSTAALFYNGIAQNFGVVAMRALHDVWLQLTGIALLH
jgi:hypothetical protein